MAPGKNLRTLIEEAKGGDRDAFGRAFEHCADALEAFIQHQLGRPLERHVEAQEVLDQAFLRASRSMGQFRGADERSFVSWLRAIAQHVILDEGRKLRVRRRLEVAQVFRSGDSSASLLAYLKASGPSPSEVLSRKEGIARLRRALETLKEEHRNVIVLVWLRGLPVKQVAQLMGRSPEATSQLLYRAILKLKEAFSLASKPA